MWIEELDNGKFKYVERYTDPATDKQKRVSITLDRNTSHSRKEAQRILDKKIEEAKRSFESQYRFREVSEEWLGIYKQTVKHSSYFTTSSYLKGINDVIGDYYIDKVHPQIINKYFIDRLSNKELLYNGVMARKSIIERVFKYALRMGYVNNINILEHLELPRINMPKKDHLKFLEREELESLRQQLFKMNQAEIARYALIQTYTGMRYGELISLHYNQDIDFEKKKISINKTYDKNNKTFTLPKSNDTREIFINDSTTKLIKQQILHDQKKMLKYNLDRDRLLLFRTKFDNPINSSQINETLKKINIKGKTISTHIFRHTFITLMLEKGIDSNLIAEHVGHSSTDMIDKIYSHFSAEMETRLHQAIENFCPLTAP